MPSLALSFIGADAQSELRFVALLLGYAMHALIWAAAAGALTRLCARRASTRHVVWMFALVGPLVTSSLSAMNMDLSKVWAAANEHEHVPERSFARLEVVVSATPSPSTWALRGPRELALVEPVVLGLLLAGLVRFGASVVLLRRALSGRRAVTDARLSHRFRAMSERIDQHSVRLVESTEVSGPLVVGCREVCIPSGVLESFSDAEVDAIFAHELAHVERWDGISFPLLGMLEAMLWAQPLHRWLSRRCRTAAEFAADERAVELTQSPMELARALIHMAEARLERGHGSLTPGMTGSSNVLVQRITSLVNAQAASSDSRRRVTFAHWGAIACLSIVGLATIPVRAVVAAPERLPTAGAPARVLPVQRSHDHAAYIEELDSLAQRAWELESAMRNMRDEGGAEHAEERLQLEQDLRHIHAMQAWAERRFRAATGHVKQVLGAEAAPH